MKRTFITLLIAVTTVLSISAQAQIKNIVLVHGAFADGSGWEKVYKILKSRGYQVSVVGHPNTGVDDDVAATQRVIDRQNGQVLLVGHSYGGAIITIAGNSPRVAGLVYVAAFAPDQGETLGQLLSGYKTDPKSGILAPENGFAWYDREKFHEGFAGDLTKREADFLADAQVPIAVSAFTYVFKDIAWKTKPSWYVVATEDHSLPPELERFMGKRTGGKGAEIKASHLVFISQAQKVAEIIEKAAKGIVVGSN
jgi:pimeloyl-ACP methyl ester carboxylesterase